MSETKFTPGPWCVGRRECTAPDYAEISLVGGPHQHIALADVVVGLEGEPYQQGEANARLIAAAPELYEALDQILDDMGDDGLSCCQAAKDQARAALAKARGEAL